MPIYTTEAKVRAYAGSPTTAEIGTAEVSYYINWVESQIERETDVKFVRGTITAEKHDGGLDRIWVKYAPLISVGTLTVGGVTKTADSDYFVYEDEGCITFESIPPEDQENISVTYVYGYSSVPAWVEAVATRFAAQLVRERLDMGLGGEGLVTAREGVRERIIKEVQTTLEKYQRIYPAIV